MEVESGATELCEALHRQRLLGSPHLHGYHCDCDDCSFDGEYPLRAQRDSSCSGEFISSPFDTMAEALPVMMALETSAVEVDAEPGYNAGFHVHVDVSRVSHADKARMFWSFFEWEATLKYIARGRFSVHRGCNSEVNGGVNASYVRRFCMDIGRTCEQDYVAGNLYVPRPTASMREDLLNRHHDNDRHSNLNVRTRHNTWEHRIWNSTRSAWRMQLWCELSLLFGTPQPSPIPRPTFNVTADVNASALVTYLNETNQPITASLLQRQLTYLSTTADSVTESFATA